MPISKESRTLGQYAAGLSTASLLLSTFHLEEHADGVLTFLLLTGTNNAAVLTGGVSILVTFYFLLRVWDEDLASRADSLLAEHEARLHQPSEIEPDLGARLERNLWLQQMVKGLIGLIDFWAPIALAIAVGLILGPRAWALAAG